MNVTKIILNKFHMIINRIFSSLVYLNPPQFVKRLNAIPIYLPNSNSSPFF